MTRHSPSKSGASATGSGNHVQELTDRLAALESSLAAAAHAPGLPASPSVNSVHVDSVAVKLPGFWKDNPRGWFHQAELAFEIRNPAITVSRTKYGHVVTSLDSQASMEVQAVLDSPPADDPYAALKTALLVAYDRTQAAKDAEFLSITSLGDLKASAMLRKMTRLTSPETASTTIFRHSFLMVLPSEVRAILATMDDPIEELAKKADVIIEARGSGLGISAIDTTVASLAQEVAALRSSLHKPARNRSSASPASGEVFVCQNHAKWGTKAYSCKSGCSFAGIPLASRSGNANASR